jgi:hypothetical protein
LLVTLSIIVLQLIAREQVLSENGLREWRETTPYVLAGDSKGGDGIGHGRDVAIGLSPHIIWTAMRIVICLPDSDNVPLDPRGSVISTGGCNSLLDDIFTL